MKIKPKYTIPVLWVIIIFYFFMAVSCTTNEKYPNKMDNIAKALSKIKK
jgi:hypothetical protein